MAHSRTFVIAEAGVNHGGNLDTAVKLMDQAKFAGADAVKFQYFSSQRLWGDDRIRHLEIDLNGMTFLRNACNFMKIEFICTPFDVQALQEIKPLLKRIKIASGCIARTDLLKAAKETGLPIILSTGMSTWDDIRKATALLFGTDLTLLHCTSAYSCPLQNVNLKAMKAMRVMGHPVGYSDHTEGILVSLAAVAAGATVIEKHLTLDRKAEGPDHKTSIEPHTFKIMVESIRQIEIALGEGVKEVQECERELHKAWRA